ncbi:MAG TPA: PD-(D/E)XK nuclease family protein [Steroidobacteraceae bacterium]|nr:PD-(D/E)XK nuclease family protein [Steroidobacteraceae bacterium]
MASLDAGLAVLAPSGELAAALFDSVERHHRAAGHEIWPTPCVRDFSSWLREQHQARLLRDASDLRVLQEVEERALWREIVAQEDAGAGLLDAAAAAGAARRARRIIIEYGIPLPEIAAAATDESRTLLAWIARFEQRCRELGCQSADQLLQSFAAAPQPLAWVESPAWHPAARRWLAAHARCMIHPAAAAVQDAVLCHSPSADAEIAAAAEWARVALAAQADFRAWICIADLPARRAEVIDAFDAALAPQRFRSDGVDGIARYAIAGGTPLAAFAPVRAALDALQISRGPVPFERFSAVLRSPQLQTDTADAGTAASLDLELRRAAASEMPLRAWLAIGARLLRERSLAPCAALTRIAAVFQRLEALRGAQPMSRWVALWTAAFEQGPWAGRRRWSSAEYQAAQRFSELLAALGAADALFGSLPRAAAERKLAAAAFDTPFQPQTGVAPIWISGSLGDPWLNYDGLWIAGMSAEAWPLPAAPAPLLPVPLQQRYGVPGASAAMQLATALDLQQRWRKRAGRAVFSLADSGEARSLLPSALLPRDLPPIGCAAPVLRPHWHAARQNAPPMEIWADTQAPPFADGERTRGVATLQAQSRCAFRGMAETRLRSDPLSRPAPGFNARERGSLMHAALERIWAALGDQAALRAQGESAEALLLERSIGEALEQLCAQRDPGARWRERERLRMRALLGRWLQLERRRADFSVERLEQSPQTARHAGLQFDCRIDRIDRLEDGARVIIDYKTGLASVDWRGERPDNPQLPMYALLQREDLVAVAYGQVNAAACRFVVESERDAVFDPRQRRSSLEEAPSLAALLGLWQSRIERLAEDFRAGHAAVAPTPRACRSCHLQGFCRIGIDAEDADEAAAAAHADA